MSIPLYKLTCSKQSLHKHKLNQHTKTPYQCAYCKFIGPSAKRFYNHYSKEHSVHIPQESLKYHCSNCAKGFEYESLLKLHVDYEHNNQGGFQLLDLIIMELKSHMTCYNSMPLIG